MPYFSTCESIIAMPPTRFYGQKPSCDQLGQVGTYGLLRQLTARDQFAGWQSHAAKQCGEDHRTRRFSDQEGDRSNIGLCIHTSMIHDVFLFYNREQRTSGIQGLPDSEVFSLTPFIVEGKTRSLVFAQT